MFVVITFANDKRFGIVDICHMGLEGYAAAGRKEGALSASIPNIQGTYSYGLNVET
jgi:hypothetical protein